MDANDPNSITPYHASGGGDHQSFMPTGDTKKTSTWIWVVFGVLLLTVTPFLCCGGLAVLGVGTFLTGMRAPINAAVESMNDDPAIAAKLGTPITTGSSFGVSEYQNHNGDGHAIVSFDATGPNGSAKVRGRMNLSGHTWSPEDLTVTCKDGTKLTLP